MFSNVPRPSSESLLPATSKEDAQTVASWRSAPANRIDRGRSKRLRVLVAAVVTTCTLTGLLTWATTSIGPSPQVSITLASTDYRNQLNLPVNAFGDRVIGHLAELASNQPKSAARHFKLFRSPIELSTASDFDKIEVDRSAAVAIVYISANGVSSPRGPLLLPADANNLDDGVELASIIQRLAMLPTSQHKVLMIDGVHTRSIPALGVIHNDFSRQVRELNSTIESIANFNVLISTDIDQQSWIDPERGTTNWAGDVVDALRGMATDIHNDGWIDLLDLHTYVSSNTESRTAANCSHVQRPLMLPLGPEGAARSRRVAIYPANQNRIELTALQMDSRGDLLQHWWSRHQDYLDRDIDPSIASPVIWQRFEAVLLRLEQFELAGCRDAADSCVDQLRDLDEMLSQPTLIDSIACRSGLLNPEMVGFDPSNELMEITGKLCETLPGLNRDAAKREWMAVAASQTHSESLAFIRHSFMLAQAKRLYESTLASGSLDRKQLADAADLIDCVRDPVQPRPQIGLIIQLLAKDFPNRAIDSNDAKNLARWLRLSTRIETLAQDRDWWAPTIFRWSAPAIAEGDRQRRLAGDLLFGDVVASARSEAYLASAEDAYAHVDRVAEIICDAEICVTQGRYQLRRIQTLCEAFFKTESTEKFREHAQQVIGLYEQCDRIAGQLAQSPPSSRQTLESRLTEIEHLTSRLNLQLEELVSQVNDWQLATFDADQPHVARLTAAMSVIGGSPEIRVAAWNRLRRFLASGIDRMPPSDSDDDKNVNPQVLVALRGKLTMASWPGHLFDTMVSEPRETKTQVLHRFETFQADSHWWESLQKAGMEIARRESSIPTSWNLAGASIAPTTLAQVCLYERQQALGRFLSSQAERYFDDSYWSIDHAEPAYFERASDLLRNDSVALLQADSEDKDSLLLKSLPNRDDDSTGFDLVAPDRMNWTTQRSDVISISIRPHESNREGFATLWAAGQGPIELLQPAANERIAQSIADPKPVLVTLRALSDDRPLSGQLNVFGYFRGRHLHTTVGIDGAKDADIQIVYPPKPAGGRISVRSADSIKTGNGSAVTLVLDCSGSMGAKPGESFNRDTKYGHAVQAVEKLLAALPTGTKLSIWAFGQAIGPQKTVKEAEQSIRQVVASIAWEPNDSELRNRVIDSVRYPRLEPWNESPLFAAMLAATADLKGHEGPRSMIVITDGHDNRISHDLAANPLGLTPDRWLSKQFRGTGITVNVIAFQVENKDKEQTQRQLTVVESLQPAGRFIEVEQTGELAEALRDLLNVSPVIEINKVMSGSNVPETQKLAVTDANETAANWTQHLEAGIYQLSTGSNDKPTLVEVRDGDQIALKLNSAGVKPRIDLWPVMQNEYRWCRQKQTARWQAALEPIATSDSMSVKRRLVVWSQEPSDVIALRYPRSIRIEASQNHQPLRLSLQQTFQQSGYGFELNADGLSQADPEIKVWISDQIEVPIVSLRSGHDFNQISDLSGVELPVPEGTLTIRSVSIESHRVVDNQGKYQTMPCLVLRASIPAGTQYRMRTDGINVGGFDEQYFGDAGQYTLRQWPVGENEAKQSLKAIHILSIDQFKKESERAGGLITFEGAMPTSQMPVPLVTATFGGSQP